MDTCPIFRVGVFYIFIADIAGTKVQLSKQTDLMMNKLTTIITISIIVALDSLAFGQTDKLNIAPQVRLPYDSLTKADLLSAINLFLEEKENDFIGSITLESNHYEKYKDFFGVFKGIENSSQYGENFYKCHLKNIVLQPDDSYKVDLSYVRSNKEL